MKALEVSINGEVIGVYVPRRGTPFAAMLANVPRTYMRAHVMSSNKKEVWQWQLPDIAEGETISFRMVNAEPGTGIPPQFVRPFESAERKEIKRQAKAARAKTMKERSGSAKAKG